ncbi:SIMPL domain-containing protein [Lyngbya aestuarii]|uniref:SIMPL domain-containing protein n=1 Tax=Lyngbya aestuarii TaxID=118322 RepID=UPI00403E32A8
MQSRQFSLPRQRFWMALAIGSFLSLTFTNPVMAQEQLLRTLTVTGQGIERIPATLTQVQLGVEVQGASAAQVQQEVAKQTSAVVDFLRSRDVKQLQTTGISLQPNYDYSDQQRRLVGYIGTNTVSFRLSVEQVGTLLDQAVQAGATRIDSISFTATEQAISSAEKEALRKAILDAQESADVVLQALNFSPKEIVSIQVNGASAPQPRAFKVEQLSRSADATTPVIGGEQTVQASVTLQISY